MKHNVITGLADGQAEVIQHCTAKPDLVSDGA
jgi:hypothetical protein